VEGNCQGAGDHPTAHMGRRQTSIQEGKMELETQKRIKSKQKAKNLTTKLV